MIRVLFHARRAKKVDGAEGHDILVADRPAVRIGGRAAEPAKGEET